MATSPISRKAVLLLALVFVLGAGFGALGTMVVNQRVFGARVEGRTTAGNPARAVGRLTQELSLTSDQQKQVSGILADMQNGYDGVRQQTDPQIQQIRSHGREEIRQVLTPEQRTKFEDYLRRLDEERLKRQAR